MSPRRPTAGQDATRPGAPSAADWLSDAGLQGLAPEDELGASAWGHLVDMLVWAACAAGLVWGFVELVTRITT